MITSIFLGLFSLAWSVISAPALPFALLPSWLDLSSSVGALYGWLWIFTRLVDYVLMFKILNLVLGFECAVFAFMVAIWLGKMSRIIG